MLIIAAECSNLIEDDQSAWDTYLTINYLTLAFLCVWIRPMWAAYGGAGIYLSQAVDQVVDDNVFSVGLWEYPLAAVYIIALYLITKRNDDAEGRP